MLEYFGYYVVGYMDFYVFKVFQVIYWLFGVNDVGVVLDWVDVK